MYRRVPVSFVNLNEALIFEGLFRQDSRDIKIKDFERTIPGKPHVAGFQVSMHDVCKRSLGTFHVDTADKTDSGWRAAPMSTVDLIESISCQTI